MQVSVIIPSYRPGDYIFECLDSVCNQTIDPTEYEVIVVLNGCNEPYAAHIREYINVRNSACGMILKQTDVAGVSYARNLGIDLARGNYITFVDDDDIISPNYLQELLLVSDSSCVGCSNSYSFVINPSERKTNFINKAYSNVGGKRFGFFRYRQFLSPPWGKMISRDLIGLIRFPTSLKKSEDSVFCFKLSRNISEMKLAYPDCIYYIRERDNSATRKHVAFSDELKELLHMEWEYLKIWCAHPFSYNLLFVLSRFAAAIRNFYRWMAKYHINSYRRETV